MARALKLKRFQIANANHLHLRGFRLRVEATEALGGMDPNVFVYRRCPPNPFDGTVQDQFVGVASFPDLAEYPVGAPDPEKVQPFFRLAWLEVDVRATSHYAEVWRLLVSEVGHLINALNKADQLTLAEEVWCGGPVPASASISASA